ncbi:mediator of RNA polymerase II transcription subunit 14-like protein [Lates japonicus]|uniref:Mediator of RNA polymerase II transcription subunit 14-like protein n=1 Tax=Lates japonicus TaxID=270547 RepID=A0AAD3RGF3_LATJO|nr:mediator of RNA polymerase II transcription subunit 14-like protein [Lates japonicus]
MAPVQVGQMGSSSLGGSSGIGSTAATAGPQPRTDKIRFTPDPTATKAEKQGHPEPAESVLVPPRYNRLTTPAVNLTVGASSQTLMLIREAMGDLVQEERYVLQNTSHSLSGIGREDGPVAPATAAFKPNLEHLVRTLWGGADLGQKRSGWTEGYEMFLNDWSIISQLYQCVLNPFRAARCRHYLSLFSEVRLYNYRKLVLCCGSTKGSSVTISGTQQPAFHLALGDIHASGSPSGALRAPSPFGPTPSPSSLGIAMGQTSFASPHAIGSNGKAHPRSLRAFSQRHGSTACLLATTSLHSPILTLILPALGPSSQVMPTSMPPPPNYPLQPGLPPFLPSSPTMPCMLLLPHPPLPGAGPGRKLPLLPRWKRFLEFSDHEASTCKGSSTKEANLSIVNSNEPGVIMFKTGVLRMRVAQQKNYQALSKSLQKHRSLSGGLQVLEVLSRPAEVCCWSSFRYNTLNAFTKLLGKPTSILRDCVSIMKPGTVPDQAAQPEWKSVLTIPPKRSSMLRGDRPAVVLKSKMLFFPQLQLTQACPSAPGASEHCSLPIVRHGQASLSTELTSPDSTAHLELQHS